MTDQHAPEKAKAQGAASMLQPKTPWQIDVYVYLENVDDPDDPQFRIETCMPLDPGNSQTIVFHNRRRPGFNIIFHLEDETGGGYSFPQDEDHAVWSALGQSCPKTATQEVFQPLRVVGSGLRLVVHNPNQDPVLGPFKYSLRVTNDRGNSFILLDPGGDNQNGPPN